MPLTGLSAIVAVAAPLSSAISSPPIRNRIHMPFHSEGGRSSFMGSRHAAAHRIDTAGTAPPTARWSEVGYRPRRRAHAEGKRKLGPGLTARNSEPLGAL